MAIPQDLKFNPSEPDKNNEFIFIDISPLKVGTPYKFQFQWIFEDDALNDFVGDNWSATYDYISKSAAGPTPVTNLTANWKDDSNNKTKNLYVRFNHDNDLNNGTNNNTGVDRYRIELYHAKDTPQELYKVYYLTNFSKANNNKVWILDEETNSRDFNFKTQFTVVVTAVDPVNRTESTPVSVLSEIYEIQLSPPQITATAGISSYSVTWSNPEADVNLGWKGQIHIFEDVDGAPVQFNGVGQGNTKPVTIFTLENNKRYVKAKFSDGKNNFTDFGNTVEVTPKSGDPTDETPPAVPTVNFVSSTATSITVNIVNADPDAKGHRLRFKESGFVVYQTDVVYSVGTTTPYTFGNLKPNTTYNISAASFDNANNLSAFSSPDINGTTQVMIPNPPTSVVLTPTASGVIGSWTPPAVQPARIDKYKVELWQDLATDVLVTTEFSFSNNISFGGLAAGTYYIKVQTQDIYGTLSTSAQSSSVSVTGVAPTDGQVPASSPAAVVNPLYGALEIKWTGISNADPVTYEIHLSTTNNFTPSPSTLALQSAGTFAIIKTLPGTSTPLTYGTTYYVKILAKDGDGPAASYGTQGSGAPSAIDNGDIAANAIRANVIRAGSITADQINSSALLANKIITVGGRSAVVIAASVSGGNITYTTSGTHGFGNGTLVSVTGMSSAAFDITNFAIQSVTANTFVVVVGGSGASGSLSNQTGVATSTVNTAIKIDAEGTGLSNSPFKFYSGAGTYSDAGTSPGTPFYLDTNGKFSLRDRLYFDGAALTVNGTINASAGDFQGAVKINNGTMLIGKGVNAVNVPQSGQAAGSLDGIYINTNNYWFSNGLFSVGGANNTASWNGSVFRVEGEINASSGKITGNLTMTGGGSVIARTTANSFNYVTLSHAGLFAYEPNAATNPTGSTPTTQIISNAAFGNPTFTTIRALIGNWKVDGSSLSSTVGVAPNITNLTLDSSGPFIKASNGNNYVGIKPKATSDSDIVLWAGLSSDGAGTPSFRVDALGRLDARDANIRGKITAGSGVTLITIGESVSGTNHGIHIANNNDYIYSTGDFKLGNGRLTNTSTGLTIAGATTINGGEVTFQITGSLESDSNNFAGDPTLTLASISNQVGASRLTLGRRFLFNGTNNVPNPPTNFGVSPNRSDEGNWTSSGGTSTKVKIGDICFIY